jgi:toxin YoeB
MGKNGSQNLQQNCRTYQRLYIERSPFSGIGKPEPLKYGLSGFWSRRISHEHRLIYKVTDVEILIAACKSHYE